jgi:hypothetical protein
MSNRRRTRGQGLVEAAMVLLVFFALLFGVVDCGQVLYAHQVLVERVRSAVRWGSLHPYDGTGEQVANLILYDQLDEPRMNRDGFLGLTRANVQVRYQPATAERPDDEMLSVAIVNYESHFFSPLIARTIVSPRPILISAPMAGRCAGGSNAASKSGTPGTSAMEAHPGSPCVAGR